MLKVMFSSSIVETNQIAHFSITIFNQYREIHDSLKTAIKSDEKNLGHNITVCKDEEKGFRQ